MHPYIDKVIARNIGLFKSLEANFKPDLNIIIGPNASGKTSLLRIITYGFDAHALNSSLFTTGAAFGIKIKKNDGQEFWTGYQEITSVNKIYQNKTVFGPSGKKFPEPSFPPEPGTVPYNLLAIGAQRIIDYKEVRESKELNPDQSKNKYDRLNASYLDKADIPDVKQWLNNRYFIIDKNWAEIERKNWEKVVKNLQQIAPKNDKFEFYEIFRDREPIFILNGNQSYLEELSSGYKSVLAIIFSITQWIETVNEGDKRLIENASGTVLIDEIDVHLHPSWQNTILRSLKKLFPNIQFIATTHSPLVMSYLKNSSKNSIQKMVHDSQGNYTCLEVNTYGDDASNIIKGTMRSSARDLETEQKLSSLFKYIDNNDLEEAKTQLAILKEEYGDLPELAKAETLLFFAED